MNPLLSSWAQRLDLRATRASRPALAGSDDERGALYSAALQQFEDLLTSAEAAGYAGRPVPLFYALSQAGRAVVAAYGEDPTVNGHGLSEDRSAADRNGLLAHGIKRVNTKHGRDAFGAVAAACGSDAFRGSASLGAIWAATPGASTYLLSGWDGDWCPPLLGSLGMKEDRVGITLCSTGRKLPRPMAPEELRGPRYPSIPSDAVVDASWGFGTNREGEVLATASWDPQGQPVEDALRSRLTRTTIGLYDDGLLVPAVNADSPAMQPLMSWWALLFDLSIFARYHPKLWVAALDADTSEVAVPLQALLDIAPDAVASLVWEVLVRPDAGTLTISKASWTKLTDEELADFNQREADRGPDPWGHRQTT